MASAPPATRGSQLALELFETLRHRLALRRRTRQLTLAPRRALLDLRELRLQLRIARGELCHLALESSDAPLGGQVTDEQRVREKGSKEGTGGHEEPRQRRARAGRHTRILAEFCYDRFVELRSFFDRAVRASFRDLALHDDAAAGYLADLLTRFARTEQLFPRGITGQRLETVVDLLLETQALWQDASFSPEREVAVRRHIGDYTLFMLGVFRERVERMASSGYYVTQGRRAYKFVSEHDRASARPVRPAGGTLFGRLADRFEGYARALDYTRRVHFASGPSLSFLA